MKNGTADIARDIGHNIAEGVSHMVDVGRKVVVEKAGDAKDVMVSSGNRALTATAKLIRKRPILSVGIAFGLGYFAMRLAHRR